MVSLSLLNTEKEGRKCRELRAWHGSAAACVGIPAWSSSQEEALEKKKKKICALLALYEGP